MRFFEWLGGTIMRLTAFTKAVLKSPIVKYALQLAEMIVPILIQANTKFPGAKRGAEKFNWALPQVEKNAEKLSVPLGLIVRVARMAIEVALAAKGL